MKGSRFMVVVALIPGLLAAVMTYTYISKVSKPKPVPLGTVPVVAAKAAIPPRTRISADMLYLKEVPEAGIDPRVARDASRVVGLVTKYEILEGEPILMDRLYKEGEWAGLASSIPASMRAVTVPVNEVVGVAGFVKPGDRVDVLVTVSGAGETGDVAFTVLEDVEVLATAQETEDKAQGKPKVTTSATLAVTPAEAERLALAEEMGSLRLALRPLVAAASKGPGVAAHDLLKTVKGWVPAQTTAVEGAAGQVASAVEPATRIAGAAGAGAAKGSQAAAPRADVIEVIRGSQTTYVTLGESH